MPLWDKPVDHACLHLVPALMSCLVLGSCGTGIEVTERVTDKDVRRVMEQVDSRQTTVTLDAYHDSIGAWTP